MGISENLVKFTEANLPDNFVSVATYIQHRKPVHAAILVRYKGKNYLHHYGGTSMPEVSESFNGEWYIFKECNVIDSESEDEVGSFLQYCKRICDRSNITYGFYADGSKYDEKGDYVSQQGLPEFGTCVGFCVNTLSGALLEEDSYFNLDDWDDSSVASAAGLEGFSLHQIQARYPKLDMDLYNAFKKRISPLEYLTSGFFDSYPIRKQNVDGILPLVEEDVEKKFNI